MIRHALSEGWLLLRQRGLISLVLALALAVPIAGGGIGLTVIRWLGPVANLSNDIATVAVLLHPDLDPDQRERWLEQQRSNHELWRVQEVSPSDLADRLRAWFPYLEELVTSGETAMPLLVEIETSDPDSVAVLEGSPEVLAVGPRTSIQRLLGVAAQRLAWSAALVCGVLLAAAALLAAVWVHLELYRHADELTIMRLVGATEGTVRGPFLVAVTIPGVVAGTLSIVGSMTVVASLTRALAVVGLPPLRASLAVLIAQAVLSVLLPLSAALITLSRHAAEEFAVPPTT
jgi:cell division transport system permease protein